MEEFRKLGIAEPVMKAIKDEKFEKPTEIQEKAIPFVLQGKDIMARSATGSGKTLVFAAGIIQHAQKGQGIQALILTPTRELAEQITQHFRMFSRYKPLEIVSVYGGVSINPQIFALRKADVVVGTPGRMLDHLSRNTIRMDGIRMLVLDEADRMLDMGFIEDVEDIIRRCPQQRQTLLFSATFPADIAHLAEKHLRNAVKVEADFYVDPNKMKQFYYPVDTKMKFSLLVNLVHNEKGKAMVFCNTKRNTNFVSRNLQGNGIRAIALHGGFSQQKRNIALELFHSGKANVLVCTDVAARGLDIKHVSHIYNYDIPADSKEYVHRIGRTARAGKEGKVINILVERDHENFRNVLRDNEVEITKMEVPEIQRARIGYIEERGGGREGGGRMGFGGRRPSFNRKEDAGRQGSIGGRSQGRQGGFGGRRQGGFQRQNEGSPNRGQGRSREQWTVSSSKFNK